MAMEALRMVFNKDLHRLRTEIDEYKSEENLWKIQGALSNSGGNLCLHLVGNLKYYIGDVLGKAAYVRDRESEFAKKNVARRELVKQVEETIVVIKHSLDMLDDSDLQNEYPMLVFAEKTSTEYMLIHLATHLSYHLGQINYHRRLIDHSK